MLERRTAENWSSAWKTKAEQSAVVICLNISVRVALGDGWLWVGKGWLGVRDDFELGMAAIVEKGLLLVEGQV